MPSILRGNDKEETIMTNVPKLFGSLAFNERVMKDRLPAKTYKEFQRVVAAGEPLSRELADIMAYAMKDWALEHGCTHFTHWFQPMTGITAEKHESFIAPAADGRVLMEFSGKDLIQGEPDASSFPSGGLRATFEARGYTAWDPTSYAFIKDNCLYIPTAFCSYTGDVLDKKTPLLRSINALDKSAKRVLHILGIETEKVVANVGPEQEYFLVDKKMWEKRRDLVYCGRTLFGAKVPKGQEMEDHYFGVIKPRVKAFMEELDEELWKLGVLAKTEHNEVAPAQHELAPIFTTVNLATDHNQLMMEYMKRIALKHGMVCLLHEKPFEGINGSGKHNNWSLSTSEGKNLLNPGDDIYHNDQFLLFLAAILKGIDEYQDVLRATVASAGNDHRLGANEAPPAIVSVFLGTELTGVLDAIAAGKSYTAHHNTVMKLSGETIPALEKDNTDRNRTSPFAFTGNKFEFRMLGSQASIACTNIYLNTIVAEELDWVADQLEGVPSRELSKAIKNLVKKVYLAHKRIVFNGNGYTDEWVAEAEKRGLLNLKSTPEALAAMTAKKNVDLVVKHGIFTEAEVASRIEIQYELYNKTLNIEALTMLDMLHKDLLPAAEKYLKDLTTTALNEKALGIPLDTTFLEKLNKDVKQMVADGTKLEKALTATEKITDQRKAGTAYHDKVLAAMDTLRASGDAVEALLGADYLPYPTYGDLLYGIND
jgi:glutamine synthetase